MEPKQFLIKLHENLDILQEREARYAGNAPLDLLNQIADHRQAIALTEQVIAGDLTEAEWQAALQPLLLPFYQGLSQSVLAALLATSAETAPPDIVDQLRDATLTHLEQTSRGQVLADGFRSQPAVYDKPVQHELAITLQNDADFAAHLHRLLAAVEAGQKQGSHSATLSGSGAIAQGSGDAIAATGPGAFAAKEVKGDVTLGSGNVSIKGSRIKAGRGAVIGSIVGGDINTGDSGVNGETLAALFAPLYKQIGANSALTPDDREDVTAEVTELAATAQAATEAGDPPDESFLRRRLRNIEAMAPDIVDTIATTIANPVAGVKGVWDKIVAKAREIKAAREK